MALKWRRKLILAKVEAAAGTAESLAAADAVLASNIELTPLAGDTVSREIEYPYYGNSAQIPVNSHQTLAFRVELASSGARGTAPAWGKLLQGCGFAETTTANTKVDYTPVSTGEKTLTLSLNIDGQLHTLKGARGTFTIEAGVNQIPYLNFTFTGLWTDPSSTAAVASPVFTAFKDPLIGSKGNTPLFSFMGQSNLALSAFSYDHANEVNHRELIGASSEVLITGRAPTGSVTIDAPAYSALNLPKKAKDADTGALIIVHGQGDGKIVSIHSPKVQASGVSYSDDNGTMQAQVDLAFLPSAAAGNDEIKLEVR